MFHKFFCFLLLFKILDSTTEKQIEKFEKKYTHKIFKFDENIRNKIILNRNVNKKIEFSDDEIQILLILGLPFYPKEIDMLKSIARSFIFNGAFDRVVSNILYSIKVDLLQTITFNLFDELEKVKFSQAEKNPEYIKHEISKIKSDFRTEISTYNLRGLKKNSKQNTTATNIQAFFYNIFNTLIRFYKIDNQNKFAKNINEFFYNIAETLERQYENDHVKVKLIIEFKTILERNELDIQEKIWGKVCHLEDLFFEGSKNDFKEFKIPQIGQIINDLQHIVLEKDKYNLSNDLHSLCFGLQNIFHFFYKLSESFMIKIAFENHESLILCQINEENEVERILESQDENEISEFHAKKSHSDFISSSENKMLLIFESEQIKNFMFLKFYNLGFLFPSMNGKHFSEKNHFFFKHIEKIVFNIEKCISFDHFIMPQTWEDFINEKYYYNIHEKSSKQINNLLDNFERFIKFKTENVEKEFFIQIDDYICFYNGIEFLPMKNFIFTNQTRFAYLRYYLHSLYYYVCTSNLREYIKIKEFERLYDLLTPKYSPYPYKLVDINYLKENYSDKFIFDCIVLKSKIDNQNKIPPAFLECFKIDIKLSDLSNLHLDNLILFGQYKKIDIDSKNGNISGIIIADFIYLSLSKNLNYNFPFIKHLPAILEVAKKDFYADGLLIKGTFDIDICFYDAFIGKSKSKDKYFSLELHNFYLYCESMIIELYQFQNIWNFDIKFKFCILNNSKYSEDEVTCIYYEHDLELESCEVNISLKIPNFKYLKVIDCKFKKVSILEFSTQKSDYCCFWNSEFIMHFHGLKIESSNLPEVEEIMVPKLMLRERGLEIMNVKCNGSLFHNRSKFESIEFKSCIISFNMELDLKVTSFLLIENCIGNLFFRLNYFDYDFAKIEFKENSVLKIQKINDNFSFKFKNINFKKSYEDFFENNTNCFLDQSNA